MVVYLPHMRGSPCPKLIRSMSPHPQGRRRSCCHRKTRDDDRPTEARIRTEHRPVVAWRIQPASGSGNDDRTTPVLSRAAYHDQLVLISLSDGGWISAGGTNYSSLDEATAETL